MKLEEYLAMPALPGSTSSWKLVVDDGQLRTWLVGRMGVGSGYQVVTQKLVNGSWKITKRVPA